jgi:hypothetical protein
MSEESIDRKGITKNVIVGVITAIVLGALGLLYNWASPSQGGIIHLLGGLTAKEVEEVVAKKVGSAPSAVVNFPKGAVVSFKEPCAKDSGWSEYADAAGRFVIGVNLDQRRGTLRGSTTQGGSETAGLIAANLPQHKHHGNTTGTSGNIPYQPNQMPSGTGRNYAPASVLSTLDPMVAHGHTIETDGGEGLEGKSFAIMPPYVALYYCQKE